MDGGWDRGYGAGSLMRAPSPAMATKRSASTEPSTQQLEAEQPETEPLLRRSTRTTRQPNSQ